MGIIYDKRDHIGRITIDNPDQANTVDGETGEELTKAWRDVWDDEDVRVAIISATGDRFFSAGHRIGNRPVAQADEESEPKEAEAPSRARGVFWPQSGTATKWGTTSSPMGGHDGYPEIWKPVIAAINGWVAGWAFGFLLSSTDIRIACEEHARFKYGLLSLGGIGGTPTPTLLPRQIAYADAMKILLTDEPFDAREAVRINLINEAVPHAELMGRAEEIATHIATKVPPVAVRMVKEFARRFSEVPVAEAWRVQHLMGALVNTLTTDQEEGRKAFREKRDPDFQGEFRI